MVVSEIAVPLVDINPNKAQRYSTHGIFRYFGKYPPTSTRMLLEVLWERQARGPVVDIMCGSGTTLLEALLCGRPAIGVDVNPISVLISKVKTEKSSHKKISELLTRFDSAAKKSLNISILDDFSLFRSTITRGFDFDVDGIQHVSETVMSRVGRWFSVETAFQHSLIYCFLRSLKDSPEKRVVQLAWLKTIRSSSYASNRTGRLFFDKQKEPTPPLCKFVKRVLEIHELQSSLPENLPHCSVLQGSALRLPKAIGLLETIFWHPPYFALYKYSSDVLRLELEWSQIDRKQIVAEEIRDGFKTSNPDDAEKYIADCDSVWQELFNKSAPGAWGVAINSDATLAKKKLDIINKFADGATRSGFMIEQIFRRPTMHTQATYHKSSEDIRTKEDYIVVFRKAY